MSQVLLFEDHPPLRGILKLNAVKLLGLNLIEKGSSSESVKYVETTPELDLIICREGVHGSSEVLELLANGDFDIPLIWLGQVSTPYKYIIMLPFDSSWEEVLEVTGKVLGIDINNKDEKSAEHEPVDCHYFLHVDLNGLGVDLYLKLKKDGIDHYVKCLHHTDNFTKKDVEKYIQSGLREFYIPKKQFSHLVDILTKQFKGKLDQEKMKGVERIAITGDAYKITMERIRSLGIDAHAMDVAEASIKSMKNSIKESDALGSFMKLMNNLPYAYANAYLTCLVCHKVASRFNWINKSMKDKLTYVAYFHNCSLKDEKLMKIIRAEQLEETLLTISEREVIFGHAHLSSLLVEGISTIPEGVATIIKEHHGAKNGFGFPKVLSTNISAMSMMFIVIEDFVDEFLKVSDRPTKEDYKRIRAHLNSRYNTGMYAQTLSILNELVFELNL